MLNHLQNEFNETQTANGAFAYNSTKSEVLDLFALGGAFRNRTDSEVIQLFSKAFSENPTLAMKTLFYLRDIRSGQGERRFFKLSMQHLALHHKESLKKNLHLVSEFGRWDDLWVLLETGLKNDVIELVNKQLTKDMHSEKPSLLGKWMSSENASSQQTKMYAKILRTGLGMSQRDYRKSLTKLRNQINIVETNLTEKTYEEIDYSKIPSKAGLIYRDAFYRNDEERYTDFLDSLSKGEVKVNSKTLYPYEIVEKALGRHAWGYYDSVSEQDIKLLDGMWNNLPNFIEGRTENSIAVVDVSGSMSGTPINVAVSLGLYLAERNKGAYHNHFLTFSTNPQLVKVTGKNIVEKVGNMIRAEWAMTTNIEAVFERLLKTAVDNNVSVEEMISKVYIISDMQFNQCARNSSAHIFKEMSIRYEQYGYSLPNLVFWNVNASMSNTPFTKDENGVMLVSGFSPSIFSNLLGKDDINPYDMMLEVITSERYERVTA